MEIEKHLPRRKSIVLLCQQVGWDGRLHPYGHPAPNETIIYPNNPPGFYPYPGKRSFLGWNSKQFWSRELILE